MWFSCIFFLCRKKRKRDKGSSVGKTQFNYRVEKEYLKPSYSASVGEELEDGLFDGNLRNHATVRDIYLWLTVTLGTLVIFKAFHYVSETIRGRLFFSFPFFPFSKLHLNRISFIFFGCIGVYFKWRLVAWFWLVENPILGLRWLLGISVYFVLGI